MIPLNPWVSRGIAVAVFAGMLAIVLAGVGYPILLGFGMVVVLWLLVPRSFRLFLFGSLFAGFVAVPAVLDEPTLLDIMLLVGTAAVIAAGLYWDWSRNLHPNRAGRRDALRDSIRSTDDPPGRSPSYPATGGDERVHETGVR